MPIEAVGWVHAVANKVLFGARSPDFDERFGVQLDGAIYDVFTIREGLIVSIEEFGQRDAALAELHRPDPASWSPNATHPPPAGRPEPSLNERGVDPLRSSSLPPLS